MGQYIYAIADVDEEKQLDLQGIAGDDNMVSVICHKDIGALVSPSPVVEYTVNRKNTMMHQKIMEMAMKDWTILPVKFGTVSEDKKSIQEKILKARYHEIKKYLKFLEGRVELGLKVMWTDQNRIFQEIIDESRQIQKLRDRLNSRGGGQQKDQIRLGEMVSNALTRKKEQIQKQILKFVDGLWVEHKENRLLGDQMVINSVFLVAKEQEANFDEAVDNMDGIFKERMKIKYIGPVPPCNFVELVVRW